VSLELRLLWAGRRQPEAWERLAADYRHRLAAFLPVLEQPIRVSGSASDPGRLRREGLALAAAAPEDGLWIALEVRGRALDSDRIAAEVLRWQGEWHRPVVFFLGSDLGLAAGLTARCRERWSLGPLTLPHALARLVLLEQLYRAFSRAAGHPYHRGG
jgi:23S rRNA (pseudouridine1915-N3)-methyltransferase